ncbi:MULTISPECIES: hypothetical protein [Bacillus amyloliquefaciens group]|uniref:hypothetical protein n=1 Tax=Bacillus amyloliquefaciens group TaxID=1938374 RepID=UPI000EFA7BBA|nr:MULTISPECIES: hypothetical protein [Bacillus amyloliquefaciens group]MCV4329350.1 hypothetical protein [Bacillus velezensis]MDQ8094839.1 hypothetical protein [Bacillus amyloliquefaciens]
MLPHIRKMSLVHDYLYNNREVAERSNDGKDQVRDRYIIVTTEEDLFAEEIPAEEHYLYSDFNEVVSELRNTVNDMKALRGF